MSSKTGSQTRRSASGLLSALSIAAALAVGSLDRRASAGTIYTSLSSFEAALASYDVTSSYSRGNLSQGGGEQSYTATGPNGYTFTATAPNGVGTTGYNPYYGYPGYGLTSAGTNDSSGTASSVQEYRVGDTLSLGSFSNANVADVVNAVGGYFYASTSGAAPSSAETMSISFNGLDPSSGDVVQIPANGPVPFIGYISSSPITSVTASDTSTPAYPVGVDFDVVGTGAVPEPASISLGVLGGIVLYRRRRLASS